MRALPSVAQLEKEQAGHPAGASACLLQWRGLWWHRTGLEAKCPLWATGGPCPDSSQQGLLCLPGDSRFLHSCARGHERVSEMERGLWPAVDVSCPSTSASQSSGGEPHMAAIWLGALAAR